jgi:hypothetical protein
MHTLEYPILIFYFYCYFKVENKKKGLMPLLELKLNMAVASNKDTSLAGQ